MASTWPDQHENVMDKLADLFATITTVGGYNTNPTVRRFYVPPPALGDDDFPCIQVLPGPHTDNLRVLTFDANSVKLLRIPRDDEAVISVSARGTDATVKETVYQELGKAVMDVVRILMENPTLGGYVDFMVSISWEYGQSVGTSIIGEALGSLRFHYTHNPLA